ncbi:MAG: hypothetical protein U0V74_13305 [Chitinophagales bacterium]
MESKEDYFELYKRMGVKGTDEQLECQADFMFQKSKTLKTGENIVHLDYYGRLITLDEINRIEDQLRTCKLELSRYDKDGVMYASLEEYTLQVFLFIGATTVKDVLVGVGTNATWDTIKSVSVYLWNTIRSKLIAKDVRNKSINFGLKMKIDGNTSFDFKIDGDMSEEVVLQSLDKILKFLETVPPNRTPAPPEFVVYNEEKKSWEVKDVRLELFKRVMEDKAKKSKRKP